jgi:hypothetical protein
MGVDFSELCSVSVHISQPLRALVDSTHQALNQWQAALSLSALSSLPSSQVLQARDYDFAASFATKYEAVVSHVLLVVQKMVAFVEEQTTLKSKREEKEEQTEKGDSHSLGTSILSERTDAG